MENQLTTFITEQQLNIPQDVLARFLNNFDKKEQWMNSGIVYDTWFKKYYKKYQDFGRGIQRELVEDYHFKIQNATAQGVEDSGQNKYKNRQIYLVSYQGLCQLEMTCDKQARVYYSNLELIIQEFYKQQIKQKNDLLIENEQELEFYYNMQKHGVIYKIYNKQDPLDFYIGKHSGVDPKYRMATHLQTMLQSVKQPFYRQIIRQGWQLYDVYVLEHVYYFDEEELSRAEQKWIDEQNPPHNANYVFDCECGKQLKQESAIFEHRLYCEQYQTLSNRKQLEFMDEQSVSSTEE